MDAILILGVYIFIAFIAYFIMYYLCAKEYSKDDYLKYRYKFSEFMENQDIIMLSIVWIFTLVASLFYFFTSGIRKLIEKYFNIED